MFVACCVFLIIHHFCVFACASLFCFLLASSLCFLLPSFPSLFGYCFFAGLFTYFPISVFLLLFLLFFLYCFLCLCPSYSLSLCFSFVLCLAIILLPSILSYLLFPTSYPCQDPLCASQQSNTEKASPKMKTTWKGKTRKNEPKKERKTKERKRDAREKKYFFLVPCCAGDLARSAPNSKKLQKQ